MTIEPRVVRTLKKTFDEERFMGEAERRKQVSDDILDIIYSKVLAKKDRGGDDIGKGVNALIEDEDYI
jgi:hypothetical protein